MSLGRRFFVIALSLSFGLPQVSIAADMVQPDSVPEPTLQEPVPVSPAPSPEAKERGIWGAIAFSPADEKYGFFWGAGKSEEAVKYAMKHCENAKGDACQVVSLFRNHRHWNDDDGTGFPYLQCAALTLGKSAGGGISSWGAASAETRREAEQKALELCGGSASECKVREWVCT